MSVRRTLTELSRILNPKAHCRATLGSTDYIMVEAFVASNLRQQVLDLIILIDSEPAQSADPVPPEARSL